MDITEGLKAIDISQEIFPKLPLLDPETGKRQDGRDANDVRPLFVTTGVRTGVRGSSYIELGGTKVFCVINGPKDLPRKVDFSALGHLSVDIQVVGGKAADKDIVLIKECLESVIILDKFPKCLMEIFFTIMEDGGSTIAACVTAAGVALLDSGIPIYDTPVGTSLLFDGEKFYLDPTKAEHQTVDMTVQENYRNGGGFVTLAYMPERDQICMFNMEGTMNAALITSAMETLINKGKQMFHVIRKILMEKLTAEGRPSHHLTLTTKA